MADLMDRIEIQKLMKILEERDIMFTVEDIRELMDAELSKDPSEMDTELIDLCVAAIGNQYRAGGYINPPMSPEAEAEIDSVLAELGIAAASEEPSEELAETAQTPAPEQPPVQKRKFKAGKILLIAAVVALLSAVAVPAGARFLPSKTTDKIIDFCYDHFKIDLRGDKAATASADSGDLVNSLILESLHTLKLPEVLLSDEYEKSARVQETDLMTTIYVDFNSVSSETSGNMMISQYKDGNVELHNGIGNVSDLYKFFEQLTVNDIEVLVFGENSEIYIKYVYENTEYEVFLNCDFDTALLIAESIE